jgi:hypothetical protein
LFGPFSGISFVRKCVGACAATDGGVVGFALPVAHVHLESQGLTVLYLPPSSFLLPPIFQSLDAVSLACQMYRHFNRTAELCQEIAKEL